MVDLIRDITKGKLLSAYCAAPFDKAKEALANECYNIISLKKMQN